MAYRRRQGMGRSSSTFQEETEDHNSSSTSSSSLAAQAIRASATHRDSSHSPAYAHSEALHKGAPTYDYTSMGSSNEAGSFWGVLARKAKAILDDDNIVPCQSSDYPTTRPQFLQYSSSEIDQEGRTTVENKTADFIQETHKLQIRRKVDEQYPDASGFQGPTQHQNLTRQEDQIKASREVAMATAAKAKLLLRELKTVKADLAFAKQRCSQLEEENKMLRDAREKGVNPEDDDMIRLQLETLLGEKARLSHENSVYARENRFLREIVEYHQMTMQDVVYIDEGTEEVNPIPEAVSRRFSSVSPPGSPMSPSSPALSRSSTTSRASSVSLSLHQLPPPTDSLPTYLIPN